MPVKDRHFYFLVGSAVLAFIVMTLADSALRSWTGSFDPTAEAGASRPGVAALQLLPEKSRSGLISMEYLMRAREARVGEKMTWYVKAAGALGTIGDNHRRANILREAITECPPSAETVWAWLTLADIKLAAKPAREPGEEVRKLIATMQAINIKPSHPLISSIRKLITNLKKHGFNDLAKTLEAATPKPKPREPEIV